jgi:hypothetical protein
MRYDEWVNGGNGEWQGVVAPADTPNTILKIFWKPRYDSR